MHVKSSVKKIMFLSEMTRKDVTFISNVMEKKPRYDI